MRTQRCGADRVFGPATATRGVYDFAAHPVVAAAMDGINGAWLLCCAARPYSSRWDYQKTPLRVLQTPLAFPNALYSSPGAGTVFAYGVTSSGKTHTMHVSVLSWCQLASLELQSSISIH